MKNVRPWKKGMFAALGLGLLAGCGTAYPGDTRAIRR